MARVLLHRVILALVSNLSDSGVNSSPILVERRFVQVGHRFVHFRTAGNGPPLVLIHQSPKSSAELVGMIRELAGEFTVFAPDTPGYGYSDPLPDPQSDIDDFVDALVLLFDALGLYKPAVFGSHSGAIFGVRLALRYPDLICALIANGVLINDQATRDELVANYFPDFAPDWEGAHLARVWSRIRDQHCYYPWYQRHPDNRIHWPASIDEMHESAMEILVAGEHYKTGYRAVLDYDITPDLTNLAVPSLLVVAEVDALVHYVPFYPDMPKNVQVKVVPEFQDITGETAAFSRSHIANSLCQAGTQQRDILKPAGQMLPAIFMWQQKAIFYRIAMKPKAPVTVFLHDITKSSQQSLSLLTLLSEKASVIAPDLAGHGRSDTYVYHDGAKPMCISDWMRELLKSLAINDVTVITEGAAWPFGMALLNDGQVKVTKWICLKPQHPDPEGLYRPPSLEPDASGSQFMQAWYYVRDKKLFSPYTLRNEQHMLSSSHFSDTSEMQQEVNDVLVSRNSHEQHYHMLQQQLVDWPLLSEHAHIIDNDDYADLVDML